MNARLTVRSQLLVLSGLFIVLLAVLGGMAGYMVKKESDAMQDLYRDRVVPLRQLKVVADLYAVNIVDTAHKVRDGTMTTSDGLASIAQARKAIATEWQAYTGHQLVPARSSWWRRSGRCWRRPMQASTTWSSCCAQATGMR